MKNTTQIHLRRLVNAHGNYSRIARHLGLCTRAFRVQRHGFMPKYVESLIENASRVLFLRMVLRELRQSGAVSKTDMARAVAVAKDMMNPTT